MPKYHDFLRGRPILIGLGPMVEVYRKIQGCEDDFIHGLPVLSAAVLALLVYCDASIAGTTLAPECLVAA